MKTWHNHPIRRKAGCLVLAHKVGRRAPLKGDFARTHLPKHWSARMDAENQSRIVEYLRMMAELDALGIRFNIHW